VAVFDIHTTLGRLLGGLGVAAGLLVAGGFLTAVLVAHSWACEYPTPEQPPGDAWMAAGLVVVVVATPIAIVLSALAVLWLGGRLWPLLALVPVVVVWVAFAIDVVTSRDTGVLYLFPNYCPT
jgi:hypothetical protein